jgi:hypothetical protein
MEKVASDAAKAASETRTTKFDLKPLTATSIHTLPWRNSRFKESDIKVLSYRDGVQLNMTRVAPGGYTFPHQHLFRQIRYIIEGEFIINGVTYGPGSAIDFPECVPYEVLCPNGGLMLVFQLHGTTTGVGVVGDPGGLEYGMTPDEDSVRTKSGK